MIVPDVVRNKWNNQPTSVETEKQKVLELERERYEQNKKIELLEMSHAALIQRIEALENM